MKFNLLLIALFCLSAFTVRAQEIKISGTVSESGSGGLPGVNVQVKGTTKGTVTDINGNYSISVASDATLIFSFVGFVTEEVTVGNQSIINVSLLPDVTQLNEIVVVGYGTVQKDDATGSLTAISTEDFNKGAMQSPQDLLVGRSAGVQITTNGGAPGSGATIRIRGGSSLSASNDPLIVIDGVILDTDGAVSGLRNPLGSINPNDIETFTVLKDASATAIYGARASNGVIIITTKRGKVGKGMNISYNGNVSVYTLPKDVDVLSGDEYRSLINSRIASGDLPAEAADYLGSANTDWQSEIFNTAVGTDNNIAVSGAYKDIPYRVSYGYSNQDGVLKTSNFERNSINVGVDPSLLDDHVNIKLNFKGSRTENRFPNEGAIGTAVSFDPTQSVKQDGSNFGGFFYWGQPSNPNRPIDIAPNNPVAMLFLENNTATVDRITTNAQVEYKFHYLPDLKFNVNLGLDKITTTGLQQKYPGLTSDFDIVNGSGRRNNYDAERKNELLETYLNYTKTLESMKTRIDLLAGYSWQKFSNESSTETKNYAENFVVSPYNKSSAENFLISFYGRANISINDKYLITGTLRKDGSSRFYNGTTDNVWGVFPSAAFAWKLKKEDFLQTVDVLSELKLRVGYGVTGNELIPGGAYPALARVTFGDDNARVLFGNTLYNTARFDRFDSNLKWEETTTINAGFDFGFLDDRITGSIDYYEKETKDLINEIPVPIGSNFSNRLVTNIGNLENKGIEITLNATVINNNDFQWDAGFNLTRNRNEITKLTAIEDPTYLGVPTGSDIAGGIGRKGQINQVGQQANSFFLYRQVYDNTGRPIEGLYVDQNEDGVINEQDLVVTENPNPDVFMGFSSKFYYKSFSLGFNARAILGNYVYNNVLAGKAQYAELYNSAGYLNNSLPEASESNFSTIQSFSDYYLEDASFFRMDNITLGYDFGKITDQVDLFINFTVQNAFVITKYGGLDPEVDGGIDNNFYPRPRTFIVGVSMNFNK